MNRVRQTFARGAMAAGMALGVNSCSVDVATCPGEVEGGNRDVFYVYCDENPNEDDLLNSPGTLEQKVMYLAFASAVGGVALYPWRRKEQPEAFIGDQPVKADDKYL